MENQPENKKFRPGTSPEDAPDPESTNDTGYAGTTNAVSGNHQKKDGYKIAIEDTMIGYDGNDEQMNMDLGDGTGNVNTKNTRGIDDND